MRVFGAILCAVIAISAYIVSYFQFREKGILLNNAYFYASEKERESMDKKPYYRQSGVVFRLIGTLFALNMTQLITKWYGMVSLIMVMSAVTVIYAIVSSIQLKRKK